MDITAEEAQNLSVGHHPNKNEISVALTYDYYLYCFYLNSITMDVTKTVYLPLDTAINNYRIDEWEALQIALSDAHMTEAECGEITIIYNSPENANYIDINWLANRTSYHYRIDGVSGDVIRNTAIPLDVSDTPPNIAEE